MLACGLAAQEARISGRLVDTPAQGAVRGMQITGDGTRVVFTVDATVQGEIELWSALSDGSAPSVRLSPTLGENEDVLGDFTVNGEQVFFRVGLEGRLYRAALDGSAQAQRLDAAVPGDGVESFELSPDGQHLVYETGGPDSELYLVPADGSAAPFELGDGLGDS
ncbi:MAG: hypothetical protein ABL998_21345, partial [Planctomycetota bacterium]